MFISTPDLLPWCFLSQVMVPPAIHLSMKGTKILLLIPCPPPPPASLHPQQHLTYSVTQTSHEPGCFCPSPQPSQATYYLTFRLSTHFLMIFHRGVIHSFIHFTIVYSSYHVLDAAHVLVSKIKSLSSWS